jgi:hypothetical protein
MNSADLPQFRAGRPAGAGALNSLADRASEITPLLGSGMASSGSPGTVDVRDYPYGSLDGFWAEIVESTSIGNAYTDERYWVRPIFIKEGKSKTIFDKIETEYDPPENELQMDQDGKVVLGQAPRYTATNLAELEAHSHTLSEQDKVRVFVWREEDRGGIPRFVFRVDSGGDQSYPAKIEEWCDSKGGTYKVSVYMGPTTLVPAACTAGTLTALAMPEGMTVPPQWFDDLTGFPVLMFAVHTKEDGLKTHWLKIGSWTVGTVRMSTNGFPIFFITDGYARSIGGPMIDSGNISLGATSTGAVDSWLRDFIDNQAGDVNQKGDSPVQITRPTRVAYNPGSPGNCQQSPPSLDFGLRIDQYDAQGHLAGIGSETQFSIVGCCPPQASISSPTFASSEEAVAASIIHNTIAISGLL